jgi:hypothetical protein
MNLERRLQKLEATHAARSVEPIQMIIFVSYLDPGPSASDPPRSELSRIVFGATANQESKSFDRLPDETEPDFLARAGVPKDRAPKDGKA